MSRGLGDVYKRQEGDESENTDAENDDMKDNFRILAILYVSGVAWGIIIDALSKIIL